MLQHSTELKLIDDKTDSSWRALFAVAGVGILLSVALILLDIAMSFTGGDVAVGGLSAIEWFAHLQSSWFTGLRNLGLFNVINTFLAVPLYMALVYLHRKVAPAGAALALILSLMGTAIYAANNQALTLLSLSSQYTAASSPAEQAELALAGTVILAQAEDFTPGSFTGLLVSNAASLWMMVVMLRGKVFQKWVSLAGLIGSSCLLIFTICATFIPSIFNLVMLFALLGGVLMLIWNITLAIQMFRFHRNMAPHGSTLAPAPITVS